jgi:hypothetical protein
LANIFKPIETIDVKASINYELLHVRSNTRATKNVAEKNVVCELSFRAGWNMVKTGVFGKHEFPDDSEEDKSRYNKYKHTIVSSGPAEATRYFRKLPQH